MPETEKEGSNFDLATFVRLFGLPPLLCNENIEHFKEMMDRLSACLQPEDFVVSLFVYHVGIETWRLMRFKRYEVLMIDRWRGTDQTLQEQVAKIKEQHKADQGEPPELFKDAPNWSARHFALSPLWDRVESDLHTIEDRSLEIKIMATFERGIDKLQDLELLTGQCQKRLNEAYAQIQWYRAGLAQDLRKEADAIVEEELKTIDATATESPLAPEQPVGQ